MTELKETEKFVWQVPKEDFMSVPGIVYGNQYVIDHLMSEEKQDWNALKQIKNVAALPGIQKASLAMPDVHPGYGFPIGGVGAFDIEQGIITVAGVGFDINCGVRTMVTPLTKADLEPKKEQLAEELYNTIPAGLGSRGDLKLSEKELDEVILRGAEFTVEKGYGLKEDLEFIEENGKIDGANPENVSYKAKERQFKEVGTLGSGNHYLEVQYVQEIFDEAAAKTYGLEKDQIVFSIHCGSRALGHQIGTDYLKELAAATRKYNINIRDKELVCAPIKSPEGEKYLSAVKGGINTAFANRQALGHLARQAFNKVFGLAEKDIKVFYEIGHNTCKMEKHKVDGSNKELLVHRKGATRAFGPGREEIPEAYRGVGQPVLVGGTMGTHSYILHGTEKGMQETFGSACHGAGRMMSRVQAKKQFRAEKLIDELGKEGIIIKGHGFKGIAEEAPGAYKDVDNVVAVMHDTSIARKVVRVKPLISIKG
jgi:tRNA-splicing ligase RtcB